MKFETLFIMVRVQVHTSHTQISDVVREIENHSKMSLSDTDNINVLETEIMLSRVRNVKNINHYHENNSFNT
ncbi:hypothetical protein [Pedobacter panaciterrae]